MLLQDPEHTGKKRTLADFERLKPFELFRMRIARLNFARGEPDWGGE
jgi:hypothetical protein